MSDGLEELSGLKEIPASEILAKIEKGEPIEYDYITVKGDLDIRKLDLPKENNKILIKSSIKINNSIINGLTVFIGAIIRGEIDFKNSKFDRYVGFSKSQFMGYVGFIGSKFIGTADFSESMFNENAIFWKSEFNGDANFWGSTFNRDASFWESKFDKDANFRDACFNKDALFGLSEFCKDALFEKVKFNKTEGFILERTRFHRIYVKYSDIRTALSQDDEAYISLVENYKTLGWFEDADECYYSYRIHHNIGDPIRHLFDWAARYSYGYGVKPRRPLAWSAFFITISSLIFFYSTNRFLTHTQSISFGDALFFSANTFTSGASSLINSSATGISIAGNLIYVVTLERLLGWVFFVLFLASIGKTIIR